MPGDSDVWLVDLSACGARLGEFERDRRLLTEPERIRAATINADLRESWIAAHAALHLVLTDHIGHRMSFAEVEPRHKPRVAGWDGEFSLAHSGSLVAIAIATRGRIGVDIEVRRAIRLDGARRDVIEAAAEAVVPREPIPGADPEMRFLAAWTRLEAIAKMRGTGIGALLQELGITAGGPGPAAVAASTGRLITTGPSSIEVRDLDVGPFDAVAALATSPAADKAPRIRDFSSELARLAG